MQQSHFDTEVLNSDIPVMVHFTLDSEYDSRVESMVDSLHSEYTGKLKIGKLNISKNTSIANKYRIQLAPTLMIFIDKKAVAQIISVVPKEVINEKLRTVLKTPLDQLQELSLRELQEAYKPYIENNEWAYAIMSGLAAGIIMAIARDKMGAGGFMVIALAYGFFILNGNFRFSWLQRLFATGLMIIIGTYGKEILEWFGQRP